MQVILAKTAGFCYGVARAVRIAQDTAEKGGGAMLGSIVHNAHVIEELERSGMRQIRSAQEAGRRERVLIRAHGESKETLDALAMRGADIVHATCPNVCRIQSLVTQAEQEGRKVVIIGEAHHPEVIGIAGWCTEPLIFEDAEKVRGYFETHPDFAGLPMILVAQTTCIRTVWESCVNFLKKECTNLKIHDTICSATQKRQSEAADIAARVDAMVIVGDRKSANTRHLTEICRERCSKVLQIETADELSPEFFSGCRTAGLTAGASTPASIIMEVLTTMTEEIKTIEGNESFEEMLEKSFKTLNTGDKVTCVVTAIGATEVQVDVGCKQAGYIPVSELSNDPDVKPEDVVKVGDEIEAYVVRVNDVEGYATLSKKRLDAVKLWEDIESAVENKTVLEGIVTEENKGGIVVSVKGVRVFVPASQSGLPKDSDLSQLLKQKVQLRITEVNRARRRVVGSIKSVTN
ncbi:MAG: 4-hydroxy-3-methylbut-2-enyl diphosphate reductase, partial [Oscillospiraceae bacterium]|nr:4-hydroxy-3-methylbut-2-enyl diphosphate reductase [Oscillospiraceae bacterium]